MTDIEHMTINELRRLSDIQLEPDTQITVYISNDNQIYLRLDYNGHVSLCRVRLVENILQGLKKDDKWIKIDMQALGIDDSAT